MPDIQIINPITYPRWDDLVLKTEDYSFFHSSAWARVLSESYDYKPLYFTIFNSGEIAACIPIMEIRSLLTGRRGVSLPFSDFCEPIVRDEKDFRCLLESVCGYGKKSGWKYVEMRGGERFFNGARPFSSYHRHILELSRRQDEIFAGFTGSTRRNIKKALREGVIVVKDNSLQSVKIFYRLNCMTRKNHGLPPQPFHFFKSLYRYALSQGHGLVILASYKGEAIAGAVFCHFGGKAMYKYGASNTTYQNLRANNLVMWSAIQDYSLNECKSLCLGRTETDNFGLFHYKDGWGGGKLMFKYYRYNLLKEEMVESRGKKTDFPKKVFGRMPTDALRQIGSLLYKHVG